jgi:beta-lactamase regulating signal transducer with metallopeptidase domain/HEAT repeat protein
MSETLLAALGSLAGTSTLTIVLLLKATIILLAALGITLMMQQRFSAGARHVVWLVTVAALLLVPVLTVWAPIPLRILPAVSAVDAATPVTSDFAPRIVDADNAAANHSSAAPIDEVAPPAGQPASVSAPSDTALFMGMGPVTLLLVIWGAVVLAIASSLGFAALTVRRIVNRAEPLDSRDWLDPLFEVSDRLGLEEPPRVLRSEDAKMPFACGVLNPTIVLPAECDNWTLDRRRAVLLHELAHVKRHDLVGHTLGRLACAIYWFHPLVWTAAKNLRSESERACDDLALSCGARATDYAEHLLDIVTSVRGDATPSVALAMARRKEFEGRMLAILDPELRHSTPSRRQSMTLIGSLAMMVVVIGAAAPAPRAPQEIVEAAPPANSISASVSSITPDAALPGNDVEASHPADRFDQDHSDIDIPHGGSSRAKDVANAIASSGIGVADAIAKAIPKAIVDAAVRATASVSSASANRQVTSTASREVLLDLVKSQGTTAAGNDERPTLLARVLLNDANAELRQIAAWGLHEYADGPVASNALATALRRDASSEVREMAAWALHDAEGSGPAFEALVAALRGDSNTQVRAISAWTLGQIGEQSAAEPLTAALSDASVEVRRRAVWGLGHVEPREAPRALIAMLNDRDPVTREIVAWSLFRIEDPAAIPALDAALRRETNKELQIAYIRALAAVGEKSVDALRSLLESTDPEIKKIAVKALAGGRATGPWPWPWPEPRPFPQ